MYNPTEAELAEMGFVKYPDGVEIRCGEGFVWKGSNSNHWFVSAGDRSAEVYPQTKEDVLTLIRLFTPPQEMKDAH